MCCPDCNKEGGCWCDAESLPKGRVKYAPRDHEKELKEWNRWILFEDNNTNQY